MAARAIAYATQDNNPSIRSAPKGGYDTEAKAKYRADVWRHLSNARELIFAPTDKVLIMPSREGLEIDVALANGIPRENLLCVDRSAAVIATSIWRRSHPDIDFMACDVGEAPARAEKRGWRIVAANLDLCGNFSEAMVQTVRRFWDGARGKENFLLGLTVAKGREGSAISYLLNAAAKTDGLDNRVAALLSASGVYSPGFEMSVTGQGQYKSGAQPMAWAVIAITDLSFAIKRAEILDAFRDREVENISGYISRHDIAGYVNEYGRTTPIIVPRHGWGSHAARFFDAAMAWDGPPESRDYLFAYEIIDMGLADGFSCTEAGSSTLLFAASGDYEAAIVSKSAFDQLLKKAQRWEVRRQLRLGWRDTITPTGFHITARTNVIELGV